MKVYTTADDSGLIWTDPDVFKRFAIGPLIYGLNPEERKEVFKQYMKMDADDFVNDDKLTGGSYEVFDSDDIDDEGNSFDIDDKNLTNNLSLRDLYGTGDIADPFDSDLYDLLDSKDTDVTVTEVDANDDGDTDKVTVDLNGDGNVDMGMTSTDDSEEEDALNKLDDAADKAAEENPISIDKVDAMADEAAEDNEFSLDKVDAMADADAARLDSTGNKSYEDKLTPEQKKLEALALSDKRKKRIENMKSNWGKTSTQKRAEDQKAKETSDTQKNILAALDGRLL